MDDIARAATELRPPLVVVKVYAWYRLLLTLFFLGIYSARVAPDLFGSTHPRLYLLVVIVHSITAALTLAHLATRGFRSRAPALFAHLCMDILALTLLMHSSGGIGSGIGFLELITVAGGSVIISARLAILLAATASLCITFESVLTVLLYDAEPRAIFPAGLLGILLFVTALIFQLLNQRLREAEATALRESDQAAHLQQLNEMIVERMLTGIVVVDLHDRIELINSAAIEHLDGKSYSPPLARGQRLQKIPLLWQQLLLWRKQPSRRCPPFRTPDGTVEIQANFAILDQSKDTRTIVFLEDTRAIVQRAQQMKLASLAKLTASIAHEIRNPLGAIDHAAQLIGETLSDPEELKHLTDIIARHTLRVNQIIENVLKLSRRQVPNFKKLQLSSWIDRFVEAYLDAHQAPIDIHVTCADPGTLVIFDSTHLEQVVTNLLDNALRYGQSQDSVPWIAIETKIDDRTGASILDVRDRGTGIDRTALQRIFDPFFSTSKSGAGLGLYLARELCETNYATLNYLFEKNNIGSVFRVVFAHPQRLSPRPQQEK